MIYAGTKITENKHAHGTKSQKGSICNIVNNGV